MTEQSNSKMLAPAEIYKVLKSAKENDRLVDNLAQIAREIARLDPAYVAYCAAVKAESPETSMILDQPASPASDIQIRKLEWEKFGDTWKCHTDPEYKITRWWESDEADCDPNTPHFFLIDDDDNQRHDTIEEAMKGAQTMFEAAANSYLVTPIAKPSEDESFAAGREKGLREGAKIAGDFVWKLYKNDGVVTSHDYEKVSETILEQIEHPAAEDEPNVSIGPR